MSVYLLSVHSKAHAPKGAVDVALDDAEERLTLVLIRRIMKSAIITVVFAIVNVSGSTGGSCGNFQLREKRVKHIIYYFAID